MSNHVADLDRRPRFSLKQLLLATAAVCPLLAIYHLAQSDADLSPLAPLLLVALALMLTFLVFASEPAQLSSFVLGGLLGLLPAVVMFLLAATISFPRACVAAATILVQSALIVGGAGLLRTGNRWGWLSLFAGIATLAGWLPWSP